MDASGNAITTLYSALTSQGAGCFQPTWSSDLSHGVGGPYQSPLGKCDLENNDDLKASYTSAFSFIHAFPAAGSGLPNALDADDGSFDHYISDAFLVVTPGAYVVSPSSSSQTDGMYFAFHVLGKDANGANTIPSIQVVTTRDTSTQTDAFKPLHDAFPYFCEAVSTPSHKFFSTPVETVDYSTWPPCTWSDPTDTGVDGTDKLTQASSLKYCPNQKDRASCDAVFLHQPGAPKACGWSTGAQTCTSSSQVNLLPNGSPDGFHSAVAPFRCEDILSEDLCRAWSGDVPIHARAAKPGRQCVYDAVASTCKTATCSSKLTYDECTATDSACAWWQLTKAAVSGSTEMVDTAVGGMCVEPTCGSLNYHRQRLQNVFSKDVETEMFGEITFSTCDRSQASTVPCYADIQTPLHTTSLLVGQWTRGEVPSIAATCSVQTAGSVTVSGVTGSPTTERYYATSGPNVVPQISVGSHIQKNVVLTLDDPDACRHITLSNYIGQHADTIVDQQLSEFPNADVLIRGQDCLGGQFCVSNANQGCFAGPPAASDCSAIPPSYECTSLQNADSCVGGSLTKRADYCSKQGALFGIPCESGVGNTLPYRPFCQNQAPCVGALSVHDCLTSTGCKWDLTAGTSGGGACVIENADRCSAFKADSECPSGQTPPGQPECRCSKDPLCHLEQFGSTSAGEAMYQCVSGAASEAQTYFYDMHAAFDIHSASVVDDDVAKKSYVQIAVDFPLFNPDSRNVWYQFYAGDLLLNALPPVCSSFAAHVPFASAVPPSFDELARGPSTGGPSKLGTHTWTEALNAMQNAVSRRNAGGLPTGRIFEDAALAYEDLFGDLHVGPRMVTEDPPYPVGTADSLVQKIILNNDRTVQVLLAFPLDKASLDACGLATTASNEPGQMNTIVKFHIRQVDDRGDGAVLTSEFDVRVTQSNDVRVTVYGNMGQHYTSASANAPRVQACPSNPASPTIIDGHSIQVYLEGTTYDTPERLSDSTFDVAFVVSSSARDFFNDNAPPISLFDYVPGTSSRKYHTLVQSKCLADRSDGKSFWGPLGDGLHAWTLTPTIKQSINGVPTVVPLAVGYITYQYKGLLYIGTSVDGTKVFAVGALQDSSALFASAEAIKNAYRPVEMVPFPGSDGITFHTGSFVSVGMTASGYSITLDRIAISICPPDPNTGECQHGFFSFQVFFRPDGTVYYEVAGSEEDIDAQRIAGSHGDLSDMQLLDASSFQAALSGDFVAFEIPMSVVLAGPPGVLLRKQTTPANDYMFQVDVVGHVNVPGEVVHAHAPSVLSVRHRMSVSAVGTAAPTTATSSTSVKLTASFKPLAAVAVDTLAGYMQMINEWKLVDKSPPIDLCGFSPKIWSLDSIKSEGVELTQSTEDLYAKLRYVCDNDIQPYTGIDQQRSVYLSFIWLVWLGVAVGALWRFVLLVFVGIKDDPSDARLNSRAQAPKDRLASWWVMYSFLIVQIGASVVALIILGGVFKDSVFFRANVVQMKQMAAVIAFIGEISVFLCQQYWIFSKQAAALLRIFFQAVMVLGTYDSMEGWESTLMYTVRSCMICIFFVYVMMVGATESWLNSERNVGVTTVKVEKATEYGSPTEELPTLWEGLFGIRLINPATIVYRNGAIDRNGATVQLRWFWMQCVCELTLATLAFVIAAVGTQQPPYVNTRYLWASHVYAGSSTGEIVGVSLLTALVTLLMAAFASKQIPSWCSSRAQPPEALDYIKNNQTQNGSFGVDQSDAYGERRGFLEEQEMANRQVPSSSFSVAVNAGGPEWH